MVDAHTVLTVDGLVRRFGELVAVDEVGFRISAGETYGLLGPTGYNGERHQQPHREQDRRQRWAVVPGKEHPRSAGRGSSRRRCPRRCRGGRRPGRRDGASAGVVMPADIDRTLAAGGTAEIGFVSRPTIPGSLRPPVNAAIGEAMADLRVARVVAGTTDRTLDDAPIS